MIWILSDSLMAVFYKKELIFDKVTDALFMFVVKQNSAVQIGLMAVIKSQLGNFFSDELFNY